MRRTEDFRSLLVALAIGSSVFAVMDVVVFTRAWLNHAVQVGVAPSALYGDANYVAMYFDPIVGLATGLVLFAGPVRWRLLGVAWLAIAGTALLVSLSKGSYLGIAGLAILIFLTVGRWRVPVLVGIILGGLALSRIPFVAARIDTTYNSLAGRAEVFSATFGMIRHSPIFGLGLGGFSYQFRGAIPEVYPHDIWLTFWVELGLLGVLTFGFILFSLLWRGWRALPAVEGFNRAVLWGVVGALVIWTLHGLVDSPYWKNDMSVEFWILAALMLAVLRGLPRPASSVAVAGRSGP